MQLKPFLLDQWLDQHKPSTEFDLAASTGPSWSLDQLLALGTDEDRRLFQTHSLAYSSAAGAPALRAAIADMQQVPPDTVQVVTGASEALLILMWLAAEPGANVILPQPGYAAFSALPESPSSSSSTIPTTPPAPPSPTPTSTPSTPTPPPTTSS